MERFRTGVLAGVTAGIIMGIVSMLFYLVGVFDLNPLAVLSRLFLTEAVSVTMTGLLVGLIMHLLASAVLGVVFVYLLKDKENVFYWGLTFGVVLYFINPGLLAPATGLLPPLWQSDLLNNIGALLVRVIFGGSLGYLVGIWLPDNAFHMVGGQGLGEGHQGGNGGNAGEHHQEHEGEHHHEGGHQGENQGDHQ
ncbi:hypothetical protein HUE98_11180 [Candidatus Contubernalis alkalaceticus]|nr:DUF1440 domain-containing protein [Candidatus Contubernalis alkalaceticus]UNC92613.1 hypothetical protein HUE98_11180 [Candidatus Contubernalis alkalaceticus]